MSSSTAAASCWSIKEDVPASTDGVYWLQTPTLVAPEQFYCDMTTDGGGWVLIGRGREGWQWRQDGQGSRAALRDTPTGPEAFSPASLPNATIDGLLNGTRVDSLTDGVRIRRAKNSTGTQWQEMRLRTTARDSWSWAIGGGLRLSSVRVDGKTYNGSYNTQSWGRDSSYLRMTTNESTAHGWKMGFAYGSRISGSNASTNYLWTYTNEGSALPFSQVFLRPKISSSVTFPAIPAAGTPPTTVRPGLVSSRTSPDTPWGVSGIKGAANELNMEVEAFARIGDTMYVGGGFQYVQKGPNPGPGEKIAQPWLAAFDIVAGEWRSAFRPVVNAMVWDLAALPDGRLAVGGEFTNINGEAGTSGLAVLDPVTGAVSPDFRTDVTYPNVNGLTVQVKALDVQDGWLYIGGRFNTISGGVPMGPQITVGRAARVSVTSGAPDGSWKPNFDGTIVDLDASAQGDRVFMAGYFDNVNWEPSPRRAVVSTSPGAANLPGMGPFVPSIGANQTYQQAILEVGDTVWMGGSEHNTQRYDRATFNLERSFTTRAGGDTQVIAEMNRVVYASCHCGGWIYSDVNNYGDPIPAASNVTNLRYVYAFDAATGDLIVDFYPAALETRSGLGGWALEGDQYGCLWFGGDFTKGSWQPGGTDWLGGFGKFCQRDATAPTTPTNFRAQSTTNGTVLTWGASTDASNTVRYEVLRGDRVVGVTYGRSWTDTSAPIPADYWVRAVDEGGNRSASTAVLVVATPDTVAPSVPANLRVVEATSSSVRFAWEPSSDDTGVTAYRVSRDGAVVATVTGTEWTDSALAPGTGHSYAVAAGDGSGNWSAPSAVLSAATLADTEPPAPVSELTATSSANGTSVALAWTASTSSDTVGYRVARNGTTVADSVAGTTLTDAAVVPSTAYTYLVHAFDAAGNVSAGVWVSVTTAAPPSNVVDLTWPDANGAGWPTDWTTDAVSGAAVQDSGSGVLRYDDVAGAFARATLSSASAATDQEVLLSYTWSSTAAIAYQNVFLRGSGGWYNAYRPTSGYGLQLNSRGSAVTVQRADGASLVNLATVSGARSVSTAKQWIRLRVEGSQVSFRTWVDGTTEPTTWLWTGTDATVTVPGQLYIAHVRGGSNVGAKSLAVSDLELTTITP